MNLNDYFKRINYTGPTDVNYETLRALQQAHLFAVPFENLDIHIPRKIILDEGRFFDKIVTNGRGGFCFEQNGLFAWVLRSLGFDVHRLNARVYSENTGEFGRPFNHMTLLVNLDERYLVDVGFGTGFIEPLLIDNPEDQKQAVGQFRIEHDNEWGVYYAQFNDDDEMHLQFRFSLQSHDLSDFVDACDYIQTSPESHFTRGRICSLAQPDGRISLTDDKLLHTTLDGEREETPLRNEAEFHQLLAEKFNIHIQTRPPVKTT